MQKDLPGNVESKRDEIKYTSSDSEVSFRGNNQINEASNESPGRPVMLVKGCQTEPMITIGCQTETDPDENKQ